MIVTRIACAMLLLGGLSGCVPFERDFLIHDKVRDRSGSQRKDAKANSDVTATRSLSSPAPVSARQITPQNARNLSQALWDEMDRVEQDEYLQENASPTPKKR